MPLVSVVISAKDAEKTLEKSLKSALQSDFADFEVVLVDDGSTDKTWEVVQSIQENDNRLRSIRNEKNLGLSVSLNKAIASCDSKYIARLDADDLMMRNRIKLQANLLDNNPSIGICGSGAFIIDEYNKPLSISPPKAHSETLFWTSIWRVPFFHPSVLFRADILSSNHLTYNEEDYLGLEDYTLWSEILTISNGYNFCEPLLLYRKHSGQVTSKKVEMRKRTYFEINKDKILKNCDLKLTLKQVQTQWGFSFGNFNQDLEMSDLKHSVEIREACVEAAQKIRPHDKSIEIGFGVDLVTIARFVQNKRFFIWLISTRFRRGCLLKSLKIFPKYSYCKVMQPIWNFSLDDFEIFT